MSSFGSSARSRRRRSRLALVGGSLVVAGLWAAGYQLTSAINRESDEPAGAVRRSATGYATGSASYRDGVYKGWGRRRHGGVEATVRIAGGRIASVDISLCDTRYPCTYIAPLPPQAVARNSASVDAISGATESSDAFAKAVADALSKAARPGRQP